MHREPSLKSVAAGDRLELVAEGAWTTAHAEAIERLLAGIDRSTAGSGAVRLDASSLEELDTAGAWLIERELRSRRAGGGAAEMVGLPARYRDLYEEVHRTHPDAPVAMPPRDTGLSGAVIALGRATASVWSSFLSIVDMLGALFAAFLGVLVRPRRFRLTAMVHHLDRVGWNAVPIILLITFLIGGIIAQQGIFHFRRFGAEDYVVDLVGILVLREIGVLIVAIMVAGRSGSSYTAELGSMKMREEIDALRAMALNPVEVLMLPRVLALIIALPILTFLGSMSALAGGGLVAYLYGGMSPEIYIIRLKEAISTVHFQVGMIKAPFMALIIGVVACAEGMRVKGSTESLGLQTTASVVKAIFLVIVVDGLFAVFFASIGM